MMLECYLGHVADGIAKMCCGCSSHLLLRDGSLNACSPPGQSVAAAGAASLAKQQEELEKKAAELQRKEQDLQNLAVGRGLPMGGEND